MAPCGENKTKKSKLQGVGIVNALGVQWWWLRSNHVDGLTLTEGRGKRFVVAVVRWGGYQLDWIVCQKRCAAGNGVRKIGWCLKSIKWICGEGMSRGAEWGGDGTKDRWFFEHPQCWELGTVQKSTEGGCWCPVSAMVYMPAGVWQHPVAPVWTGCTIWTAWAISLFI